jgi:hypothetical protein
LLSIIISPAAGTYSEPFKLGNSTLFEATAYYGRHLAVGSDGVVHIVWGSEIENTGSEVWYTHSGDSVNSFVPATTIHEGRTGTRPAIAVDPANPRNVFVVYCGSSMTDKKIGVRVIKSTDGGNTWSSSVTVSGRAGTATNPDLIVDGKGNPHVVFNSVYLNSIWYTQSLDGGITWLEQPEMVNVGLGNGYGVCLSLSPAGELHVLFDSDKATMTPGDKAVFWTWKYNDPDEPIWQLVPAQKLPGSGDGTPYPTIVWDSKGVGHAWFDAKGMNQNNRNVYYVRYENETWTEPQVIPSTVPGGSTYLPSASIDPEDNLYVIFLDALQQEVDLEHHPGDIFAGTNRSGRWEYFNLSQNGLAEHERFPGAARDVVDGVLHLIYTGGPVDGLFSVIYQNCFKKLIADFEVMPTEYRVTLPGGCEKMDTLVISNSGTALLEYAISMKTPEEVSWLKFSKTSGKISGGAAESIGLIFDAKLLDAGDFAAEFQIETNAPEERFTRIPVALQVEETCPPPCFQLSFFQGIAGDQINTQFSVNGNPDEINSFQFDIFYPAEFVKIQQVQPGNLTAHFENFTAITEKDSVLKISGKTQNNPIPRNSQGSLADIRFEIIDCAGDEKIPIQIKCAGEEFQKYALRHGRFICQPVCQLGEINRDGAITSGDALCAFQYFLSAGNPPAACLNACLPAAADVNCDGQVTPSDALGIFMAYLQDLQPPLECSGLAEMSESHRKIQLSSAVAAPGNKITCDVLLETTANLQAFGFDLHFPADLLTFIGTDTARLTRDWVALDAHEVSAGMIRIGGFNPDSTPEFGTGTVTKIRFMVKNNVAGTGAFFLENLKDDFDKSTMLPGRFSTPGVNVALENTGQLPAAYSLEPNFPNPFNLETVMTYHIPESGQVNLTVYNAIGQKICTLVSQIQPAGNYAIKWIGMNDSGYAVPSGIYLVRMEVNQFQAIHKILLLK